MERTVILPAPAAFQFNGGGRVVKANCRAVLFLSLAAGVLGAQDIQVQSTTVAQLWKLDTPGMDTRTYAPAVQFLGIDASGLGYEGLTLHLFGWGRGDLADASLPGGKKGDGDLTYGYLRYRFATANAEIKDGKGNAQFRRPIITVTMNHRLPGAVPEQSAPHLCGCNPLCVRPPAIVHHAVGIHCKLVVKTIARLQEEFDGII